MLKKLMNEFERVVIVRERYKRLDGMPQAHVKTQISMMTHAIELAKESIATNDVGQIILAIKNLEGWQE